MQRNGSQNRTRTASRISGTHTCHPFAGSDRIISESIFNGLTEEELFPDNPKKASGQSLIPSNLLIDSVKTV